MVKAIPEGLSILERVDCINIILQHTLPDYDFTLHFHYHYDLIYGPVMCSMMSVMMTIIMTMAYTIPL